MGGSCLGSLHLRKLRPNTTSLNSARIRSLRASASDKPHGFSCRGTGHNTLDTVRSPGHQCHGSGLSLWQGLVSYHHHVSSLGWSCSRASTTGFSIGHKTNLIHCNFVYGKARDSRVLQPVLPNDLFLDVHHLGLVDATWKRVPRGRDCSHAPGALPCCCSLSFPRGAKSRFLM